MDIQFTENDPNEVVERLADPRDDFYSIDNETDPHPLDASVDGEMPDLSGVISEFLQVCTDPTDGQIHMLADALGVDHADLERQMFALLAEFQQNTDDRDEDGDEEFEEAPDAVVIESMVRRVLSYTTDEAVMNGQVPDDQIPTDQLYLNDGATGENAEIKTLVDQNLLIHDGGAIPPNPAKV
jgi:hypothetical protein